MKRPLFKVFAAVQVVMVALWSLSFGTPLTAEASTATVKESFRVSGGVQYQDTRLSSSTANQAVRVLEINVNDPYTQVGIGYAGALNKLSRTTVTALANHRQGHLVVGAVNGNFFFNGTPMNLVSKDNRLVHAGIVPVGKDKYVNEPIVFGMNASGKGQIDHYELDLNFVHNGTKYAISSTNKDREPNNIILYTSYYPFENTRTNAFGTEIAVSLEAEPSLEFGSSVTGIVEKIRKPGDATPLSIPKNGFIISGHGAGSDKLANVGVGDEITLNVNVDAKWHNSSFMLASGPMLVKDGKVSLTMDPNSPNAREKAPRTAVAIDRTGTKVFFVTVDGRQKGYSTGMNLPEFAQHLVSLGAYRALNLDGGGSTTMAVRNLGSDRVQLKNSPSDKSERAVSAVLMAVSTAPAGQLQTLKAKKSVEGPITVGKSIQITPAYALDQFYNPVPLSNSDLIIEDLNKLGKIEGNTFTALKTGKGTIKVTSGQISTTVAIEVIDNSPPVFSDVKNDYWAAGGIKALVERKIINGYPDGTFKPASSISRRHAALMIARTMGLDTTNVADPGFKDVPNTDKNYKEIAAVANAGLLRGRNVGEFAPEGIMTRAEMAVILQRAFKLPYTVKNYFPDVPKGHYAYDSVNAIAEQKISSGYPDGTFKLNNEVTRAEFSVFIYNSLNR